MYIALTIAALLVTLFICFDAAGYKMKEFIIYAALLVSGIGVCWLLVQ